MIKKTFEFIRAKTINLLFVSFFTIFAFYDTSSLADELTFSRIASDLEQKILIKSDIIEAVRTGVSQLQKACDLENNEINDDTKNKNPLFEEIENNFLNEEIFREKTQNTLMSYRANALQTYRTNCSILGQIIGSNKTKKSTCENAKGTVEFVDRLIPSLNKNLELEKMRLSTLITLFQIEELQCTSPTFSNKIYTEFQTVLEPLNSSIVEEFLQASELIE